MSYRFSLVLTHFSRGNPDYSNSSMKLIRDHTRRAATLVNYLLLVPTSSLRTHFIVATKSSRAFVQVFLLCFIVRGVHLFYSRLTMARACLCVITTSEQNNFLSRCLVCRLLDLRLTPLPFNKRILRFTVTTSTASDILRSEQC
jgi:hypothetical protein